MPDWTLDVLPGDERVYVARGFTVADAKRYFATRFADLEACVREGDGLRSLAVTAMRLANLVKDSPFVVDQEVAGWNSARAKVGEIRRG